MKGFTLAETVVVVAILGAAGVALSGMIAFFYKSNAYLLEQTSAVDSASRGLSIAHKDIREASYGEDGAYPIAVAATSTITLFSDVDGDGPVEKVRFYIQGGTLYRAVTNAAGNPPSYTGQTESISTIASSVTNASTSPLFRYYGASGAELTGTIDIAAIRSIRIQLLTDLNPQRAPNVVLLERSATLRNLRN
jgi:prepilin-type N-terminal cleavage/methylation domain-containing protein